MSFQSPYVYVITTFVNGVRLDPAMFLWPNGAKKYLRDSYTLDGKLCLPPRSQLIVSRHKLSPKPGYASAVTVLDAETFLAA